MCFGALKKVKSTVRSVAKYDILSSKLHFSTSLVRHFQKNKAYENDFLRMILGKTGRTALAKLT